MESRQGDHEHTEVKAPAKAHEGNKPAEASSCGCSGGSCGPSEPLHIGRRRFLQVAGAGVVATTLSRGPMRVMAGPFDETDTVSGHLIPADKKLSPEWVRSLFERGTKEVFSGESLDTIGMPCGGIGAGQLYLCGDGTLGSWQIFNDAESNWVEVTMATYAHRGIAKPVEQGFAIAVERPNGDTTLTPLNRDGFAKIEFKGEYPIGTVRYADPDKPVRVEMEAFSPFIPLNAPDSGLPCTLFHLTVENTSAESVRASALGWLQNAVCKHYGREYDTARMSEYRREDGYGLWVHAGGPSPAPPESPGREPILFEDFERRDWGEWEVSGNAFGRAPSRSGAPRAEEISGYKGEGFASSTAGGEMGLGKLVSPVFVIDRHYINFLISGGWVPKRVTAQLEVDGEIVRTSLAQNSDEMEWRSWAVHDWEGREARIIVTDEMLHPWGRISVDQFEFADSPRAKPAPLEKAADFGTMALACADAVDPAEALAGPLPDGVPAEEWLGANSEPFTSRDTRHGLARTGSVELAPGEKHSFTFVLAWHFPNQYNGNAFAVSRWEVRHGEVGQYYSTRFEDAAAVVRYVFEHHERLSDDTRRWRDLYYDSSLPYWFLDRVQSTVSCLATGTCEWWENGRFYAYEGVTCCHGTCTHVWNYAHAHARLFPELARSVREQQDFAPVEAGGGFHPDTGLVGFRGDSREAADGQAGTILKAYREHQMSSDNAFLEQNWPTIKKALQYLIDQDGNGDGLIENRQHNTYDIDYYGANTMVGSLYLAALRAAEEMALELGDRAYARRVRAIFESGSKLTDERLFNGEYYIQDVDLEKHPMHQYKDGCLSDQVFGQGWAHQAGLGYIYQREHVVKALESVWKYNWAPDIGVYNEVYKPFRWFVTPGEAGLITCTWPKSEHLPQGTMYAEEVWTGIEYQVAGHMIWEGMLTEGMAICRAVHDRYHPDRFNPYNEVECGDHYSRAMASWGVYLALAGFEYHGPKGWLRFAPRLKPEKFQSLVTTAEGWVRLTQDQSNGQQTDTITVERGALQLSRLTLETAGPAQSAAVSLRGAPVAVTTEVDGAELRISFTEPVRIEAGDALEVRVNA